MEIRTVLIGVIIVVTVWFVRSRNAASIRAAKKASLIALAAFAVLAVLIPDAVDFAARILGVGRGTDLLLYFVTVAFFAVTLNTYLKFLETEHQIGALVREIALLQASLQDESDSDH